MKYLGYTLTMDGGRYYVTAPDGSYIGSGSKEAMRRWIREHRAAQSAALPVSVSNQGLGEG